MARLGLFDPTLRNAATFDLSSVAEGWFDPDFVGTESVAPPALPSAQQGGGYLPLGPVVVKPEIYVFRGVVFLGRLRVGSRVVYFRNLAIEEEDDIIALL